MCDSTRPDEARPYAGMDDIGPEPDDACSMCADFPPTGMLGGHRTDPRLTDNRVLDAMLTEAREGEDDHLDDDRDQENPAEYSEKYDWSRHDFDSDPDWR